MKFPSNTAILTKSLLLKAELCSWLINKNHFSDYTMPQRRVQAEKSQLSALTRYYSRFLPVGQ